MLDLSVSPSVAVSFVQAHQTPRSNISGMQQQVKELVLVSV